MENQSNKRPLLAAYRMPGFRTSARIDGYEHTHPAFVITLVRRQKNGMQRLRKTLLQLL